MDRDHTILVFSKYLYHKLYVTKVALLKNQKRSFLLENEVLMSNNDNTSKVMSHVSSLRMILRSKEQFPSPTINTEHLCLFPSCDFCSKLDGPYHDSNSIASFAFLFVFKSVYTKLPSGQEVSRDYAGEK